VAGALDQAGRRRHLRRDYLAHSIEGGLFTAALGFVSATTLLPPIFTARGIDRLRR